jgi:hypothetical protein
MKHLIMIMTLMTAFNSFASKEACIGKLTHDYNVDSRAFKVDTDAIFVVGHENDHLAQAISIIRSLLDLEGCDGENDINFGHGPLGRTKSSCKQLIRGREYSISCYVETDMGFFFVTRDLQTNAYVVFSRWD